MNLESNLSQQNFSEDNDINETYEAFTNAILHNKHAPLRWYRTHQHMSKKLPSFDMLKIAQN